MGDPNEQKGPKEQPGSLRERLERLKGGKEETEKEKERAETETKKRTARETPDIKREVLGTQVFGADKETGETIMNIEKLKERQEILRALERLGVVTTTLLAKFFENGISANEVKTLHGLQKTLSRLDADPALVPLEQKLNSNERSAVIKLKDILSKPGSPLYLELETKWKEFLQKSRAVISDAKKGKEAMEGELSGAEKVKKGASKVWEWVKAHPVRLLIAAGAAYGIYKVIFSKKDKGPKESWTERIFDRRTGIGLGLGALVLGVLAGDKIFDWLKKFTGKSWEKLKEAKNRLKEGDIMGALMALVEGPDENAESYRKLAEAISKAMGKKVDSRTIKGIAGARYDEFMSAKGEGRSFLMSQAKKIPGVDSALIGRLAGNAALKAAQEKIVREYLKKHEEKIKGLNLPAGVTILEVLGKLNNLEVAPVEKPPSQIVEDPEGGKPVGVEEGMIEDLKEQFRSAPNFQNFIKKYQGRWSEAIWSPVTFSKDLYEACKADGIPVLAKTTGILAWNGYKWVALTTVETLSKTFMDLATLHPEEAVWDYLEGTSKFILLFGGTSALVAKMRGANAVAAAFQGAGRGLIFPVEVAHLHIRAGQAVYRTATGAKLTIDVVRAPKGTPEHFKALEARTKFYAEIARKYELAVEGARSGSTKLMTRIWGTLNLERLEGLKNKFQKRFVDAYNAEHMAKQTPGFTKLDLEDPVAVSKAREAIKKTLGEGVTEAPKEKAAAEKATEKTGEKTVATKLDEAPKEVKVEGTGKNAKYHYEYNGEKIVLTNQEISERANEIMAEEKAQKTAPKKKNVEERAKWKQQCWDRATKELANEKILTPTPVEGKPNTYRFAGQEITFTPEQIQAAKGDPEALRKLAMEQSIKHITIEDFRIREGKYEYKMGGKWYEAEKPGNLPQLEAQFKQELMRQGKSPGEVSKLLAEGKALRFLEPLQKILGTAAAIAVIVHLETAADKQKAVAETAAGFGAFFAGMKLADWQLGSRIAPTSPGRIAARTAIALFGGIAAAFGFTKPIGDIVHSYYSKVPGGYAVSNEVISLFEKATLRSTTRMVLHSAEKGLLKKAVAKAGLHSLERFFEKKVESAFLKKIGQIAAKKGFRQILKALGWRGVTTAALLADDATVIGVVDDIVAAGFLIWMGFDIYDIVKLVANAQELEKQMETRSKLPMEHFEVVDNASRVELQKKLIPYGKTVEQAHELGEEALFDILRTLPQTKVQIRRKGADGYELWTLQKGQAVGIKIVDGSGKTLAEVKDEDAKKLDESLDKVETKEVPEKES